MKRITSAVLVLIISVILISSASCNKVPSTTELPKTSDQIPTVEQFPLTVTFPKTFTIPKYTLQVGEQVTVTASIVNDYGKTVEIKSSYTPNFFFRSIDDTITDSEFATLVIQTLNAGEKLTRTFVIPSDEPGEYLLDVYYKITVDGTELRQDHETITITIV
ncbi:MAG: hypothetical protein LBN02_08565 [Oscillospiraceae bacterium]|jgi:hypothetical protein|nr:hypothetical protein [Oscillospiraceae bacterium]